MSGRAAAAGCYSVGPPRQSIPWSALSEIGIAVSPGSEYLVHRRGFLAGTPGIEVTTGYQLPFSVADGVQFILRRIGGAGRAWIELSGDVVMRELAAGTSLRTHPWHIGMFDASVALQMAELHGVSAEHLGDDATRFAVLCGPGSVWLQSIIRISTRHRIQS